MCKSGICDTKPAIVYISETKQSRVKLTTVSIETHVRVLSIDDKCGDLYGELWLTFPGGNFSTTDIAHFSSERDEIWQHWRLVNRNLFHESRELWSKSPQ